MAKSSAATVSKVIIKIGDVEHTLTVEQAKELQQALGELFGDKTIIREEHHHHDYYPRYRYWISDYPAYSTYGTITTTNTQSQATGVYTLSLSNTQ